MAEKNLKTLLSSMSPHLHPGEFVFTSITESEFAALNLAPLCLFREDGRVSLIVEKYVAEQAQLDFSGTWSQITCQIQSDLTAVGFLAEMSTVLAKAGIAVNAVSALAHDHLFVPAERSAEAMELLSVLSSSTK